MTSTARRERELLCDLFLTLGPGAPTLCAGWRTRDLAAHLVLREGRPDAALGIVVPLLAGHTGAVQHRLAEGDWGRLVQRLRAGPPAWTGLRLGSADAVLNTAEFFVHHEDVRRAAVGWQPRELDDRTNRALWRILTTRARAYFRHSPVAVRLRHDDDVLVARAGAGGVVLVGEPAELLVYSSGRTEQAIIDIHGPAEDVSAFRGTDLSI